MVLNRYDVTSVDPHHNIVYVSIDMKIVQYRALWSRTFVWVPSTFEEIEEHMLSPGIYIQVSCICTGRRPFQVNSEHHI